MRRYHSPAPGAIGDPLARLSPRRRAAADGLIDELRSHAGKIVLRDDAPEPMHRAADDLHALGVVQCRAAYRLTVVELARAGDEL